MILEKDERVMEILTFRIRGFISREDFPDCEIDISVDYFLNALVVNLKKTVLGETQIKKVFVKSVPKTWKDHFKEKYQDNKIMKLWIKKKPIEYETIECSIVRADIFPDYKIPDSLKGQKHIIIYQAGG